MGGGLVGWAKGRWGEWLQGGVVGRWRPWRQGFAPDSAAGPATSHCCPLMRLWPGKLSDGCTMLLPHAEL